MASLGRHRLILRAVPKQNRFAQPCPAAIRPRACKAWFCAGVRASTSSVEGEAGHRPWLRDIQQPTGDFELFADGGRHDPRQVVVML